MTKLPRALDLYFSLPFTDTINSLSLAGGAAESMTVPTGAYFVAMSANADFFARVSGTAAAATDITDGTGSALNPTTRRVTPGDVISVFSSSACLVTFEFFGVP